MIAVFFIDDDAAILPDDLLGVEGLFSEQSLSDWETGLFDFQAEIVAVLADVKIRWRSKHDIQLIIWIDMDNIRQQFEEALGELAVPLDNTEGIEVGAD